MVNEIRHAFEIWVRKDPYSVEAWTGYASWEASKKEFKRSTEVWERAVAQNHRNAVLWLRYAQFARENLSVNDVRTVLSRAVTHLPGNSHLWHAWVLVEESLGNVVETRCVFERWMYSGLNAPGWLAFARFENRYGQLERARLVFEWMVMCHADTVEAWMEFVAFEEAHGDQCSARSVYQRAVHALARNGGILAAFRSFEERCRVRGEDGILGKRKLLGEDHAATRNVRRAVSN